MASDNNYGQEYLGSLKTTFKVGWNPLFKLLPPPGIGVPYLGYDKFPNAQAAIVSSVDPFSWSASLDSQDVPLFGVQATQIFIRDWHTLHHLMLAGKGGKFEVLFFRRGKALPTSELFQAIS